MSSVLALADATSPALERRVEAAAHFAGRLATSMAGALDMLAIGDGTAVGAGARRLWRVGAADGRSATRALIGLLNEQDYGAIVLAETALGREVAGRLCASAGLPVVGSVLSVSWREGVAEVTRAVEGGRRSARLAVSGRPAVLLLDPDVAGGGAGGGRGAAPAAEVALEAPPAAQEKPFAVLGEERVAPEEMDVADADVVVAGGRGMGGPDGFRLLQELAAALNGAVGATRVAVDAGWAPRARQVGLTGKTVSPRLYVACGISGAIHHTLGMRESGFIVAINSDPQAPIFKMANVSLVGDAREIVENLVRHLRSRRQGAPATASLLAAAGR